MTYHLHHGECLDYLRTLPDQSVDHCIMDPPYEAESHTKARRSLCDGNTNPRKKQPLEISFSQMTEDLRASVSIEVARVTRRWVLAFCQMEAIGLWRACMVDAGLDWVRGGVWIKPNGSPQFTGDRPGTGQEAIAIAHQPGKKKWNGGGKHGIWYAPLEHYGNAGMDHPTIKPQGLMRQLVQDFTDPGDTILDPFAGSGSTGVAALSLGRSFIGCEMDAKYHALATERLRAESQGLSLASARAGQLPLLGTAPKR